MLDVEIRYAWSSPWNLGKVLFFLTRYPVFFDVALMLYREWHQFSGTVVLIS